MLEVWPSRIIQNLAECSNHSKIFWNNLKMCDEYPPIVVE